MRIVWGILALGLLVFGADSSQTPQDPKFIAAYYKSWLATTKSGEGFDPALARLPCPINVVDLAFLRPDADYRGGLDLSGTGLEFHYAGAVLKASIRQLKASNPGAEVLVSVGGRSYSAWGALNAAAIARFVSDFALDGVDIDFEPSAPQCRPTTGTIACATDGVLARTVAALRAQLPHPLILSLTATSTGAYGRGPWKSAAPTGGDGYGMLLDFLRNPRASGDTDFLSIMAYDAGPHYDPVQGYEAYSAYYRGPILMGFMPPPENWGGHAYTADEVTRVLHHTLRLGAAGSMLFGLQELQKNDTDLTPWLSSLSAGASERCTASPGLQSKID